MMHGVTGSEHDFDGTIQFLKNSAKHRNTPVHALTLYSGPSSLLNDLMKQMKAFYDEVKAIEKKHKYTKYHFLCFSQGALICRTALQYFDDLNVENVILVASPQMGQFGVPGFLKQYFPNLVTRAAHFLFYTKLWQDRLSIANYWRDPFEMNRYFKHCSFLPLFNGEIANGMLAQWKKNFVSNIRANLVIVGGSGDDIITPPTSALFEWWPEKKDSGFTIPMEQQPIYTQDRIGLRTLAQQKRLFKYSIPGVTHGRWMFEKAVFDRAIEPWFT